jgi:hypothetical protein
MLLIALIGLSRSRVESVPSKIAVRERHRELEVSALRSSAIGEIGLCREIRADLEVAVAFGTRVGQRTAAHHCSLQRHRRLPEAIARSFRDQRAGSRARRSTRLSPTPSTAQAFPRMCFPLMVHSFSRARSACTRVNAGTKARPRNNRRGAGTIRKVRRGPNPSEQSPLSGSLLRFNPGK